MKTHIFETTGRGTDPSPAARADEVAAPLQSSALFEGVSAAEVRAIVARFDEQRFNAGHRITLEGLRGSDFFVILDGRARVSVDQRTVGHLGSGDFFGELGVLGDGLRFATVTAETPLHCLVLPHGELRRLLIDHPQVSVNVLAEVVSRFKDLAGRGPAPAAEMATR